jgi:hypothetical protein
MNLIQRAVAVAACMFTPVLSSAQPLCTMDADSLTLEPDPQGIEFGSIRLAPTSVATSVASEERVVARSFEQLQVFVGPGDTIALREASGEEFSARIADLSATELVVMVDGRRRAYHADDVIRIRQRRGDSLANGTWLGFGIGAGLGLVAVAADDSGFIDNAGWAVVVAAIYGGIGAGIGVGVDALIRRRQVIYDHQPGTTPAVAIVPFLGVKSAGAMVTLRF